MMMMMMMDDDIELMLGAQKLLRICCTPIYRCMAQKGGRELERSTGTDTHGQRQTDRQTDRHVAWRFHLRLTRGRGNQTRNSSAGES